MYVAVGCMWRWGVCGGGVYVVVGCVGEGGEAETE